MTGDQTGGVLTRCQALAGGGGGGKCFSYIVTIFIAIKYVDIITPHHKGTWAQRNDIINLSEVTQLLTDGV